MCELAFFVQIFCTFSFLLAGYPGAFLQYQFFAGSYTRAIIIVIFPAHRTLNKRDQLPASLQYRLGRVETEELPSEPWLFELKQSIVAGKRILISQ